MPIGRWATGASLVSALAAGLVVTTVRPLPAQEEPYQIQWYQPLIALAGVSVFFLVDDPVRSYMLDNQTTTKDDIASGFKVIGEPRVFVAVPAVMMGAGLAFKKPGLTHAGLRAVSSAVLAGGINAALKVAFGRERPIEPEATPFEFEPFSLATDDASMPSGHTATAFGLMASLAEDVRPAWAKVGLYALATGTAWSRVYNNKHWTSDVVFGALVGVTSAKVIRGEWKAWGIRMPAVFTDGTQVTVSWQGSF